MVDNITTTSYYFWEYKGDHVDKWFLMSSPIPVLSIWITYLAFVLKVGPAFMKNRKPFVLNNVLVLYNAVQVLMSCLILCIGSNILFNNGLFLQKICESDNATFKKHVSCAIHCYFFAKVTEMLDTVFFVLRKKSNQVTFLHVYHHSITVLFSWFTLKYEPSQSTIFLGTLNSFVHIFMYSYYGLSTFPELSKYLWWKKYITSMQLVQFLMITLQVFISYKLSPCRPSFFLIAFIIFNTLFFMYLFSNFYIRSYVKNDKRHIVNGEDQPLKNVRNINMNTVVSNNNRENNLNYREIRSKKDL